MATTQSVAAKSLPDWLAHINRCALPLYERVRALPKGTALPAESVSGEHFDEWCRLATASDRKRFLRRFVWDSVDVGSVSSTICESPNDSTSLPGWAEELANVVALVAPVADAPPDSVFESTEPLPFEDVLLPFVVWARQRIHTAYPLYSSLASHVRRLLERGLLASLAHLSGQTLYFEFSLRRAMLVFESDPLRTSEPAVAPGSIYSAFIDHLRRDSLLSFFEDYPVLARLLSTSISLWVEATGELVERLRQDKADLQKTFGSGIGLEDVSGIETGLSDRHHGGRSVAILSFANGLKVVYKPKPLALDQDFFALVDWVNQAGLSVPLRTLRVLTREEYGWTEHVEAAPLDDAAASVRFYRGAGMLLCLAYILGEIDWHFENLIASGESPVAVDFETLLHPRERARPEVLNLALESDWVVNDLLDDSVMRTSLLPPFGILENADFDSSGLAGDGGQKTQFVRLDWQHVNTDQMDLVLTDSETLLKLNLPRLNGEKLSAADFEEELIRGFREVYELICSSREFLLAPGGLLGRFARHTTRFVLRSSSFYSHILLRSCHPDFLRNGLTHSIQLDILSSALLKSNIRPASWPALRREHEEMEMLDIPYFRVAATSDCVEIRPGEFMKDLVRESGFERMLTRVRLLGDSDLELQTQLIRASLETQHEQRKRYVPPPATAIDHEFERPCFLNTAMDIASRLIESAIPLPSGGATWMTPLEMPVANPFRMGSTDLSLYEGAPGLAVFLSAAHRVSGNPDFASYALKALQPLRDELARGRKSHPLAECGVGGATGLGSMIYGLVLNARLLANRELLEDAGRAADLLDVERIHAGENDVVRGAAGAILSLLALHRETNDASLIKKALVCAECLLARRKPSPVGHRLWPTSSGRFLTGYSHGASGFAGALARLGSVTSRQDLLSAAIEALEYERCMFRPEAGNWLDLRHDSPAFSASWCHGAAGIGLARTKITDHWQHAREEIEFAAHATVRAGMHPLDLVCCGNFGRTEFLLETSRVLDNQKWAECATQLAHATLARRHHAGDFRIFDDLPPTISSPGLFCGLAGIGYALLRLDGATDLPCFLNWE